MLEWENIRHCRDEYHASLFYLGHQPGVKATLTPLRISPSTRSFHGPAGDGVDLWRVLAQVGLAGFGKTIPRAALRRAAATGGAGQAVAERATGALDPDEPFTAIDKQGVRVLEQLFLAHADRGAWWSLRPTRI